LIYWLTAEQIKTEAVLTYRTKPNRFDNQTAGRTTSSSFAIDKMPTKALTKILIQDH